MTKRDVFEPLSRRMKVSGLRQNNERAVLSVVAIEPGSSAAQIARKTGLGPQSVSRILAEFESVGLVYRGEARRGQRGQPAVPIYMDPGGVYSIGCEIGWRHMHILIRNLGGEVLGQHRRDYDYPEPSIILKEVGSLVQLLVGLVPEAHRSRILGIGLAMPSGIARNADLLGTPPEVAHGWRGLDVAPTIEEMTGLLVYPFNDGNAGCWGELGAHPPPRPNNFVYLQVGTFVAAGLVAEGRLWEGPSGNSANLGSMIVTDRQGQQQFVHLIASIYALEQRLHAAGKVSPKGNPAEWDWEALEPEVTDWLDEASRALAKVIINTSAVMEFGVAIVDGVMSRAVVARLVELVNQRVADFPVLTTDKPAVEMGRLGGEAPARGAAAKPMYRRLFSRETADLVD